MSITLSNNNNRHHPHPHIGLPARDIYQRHKRDSSQCTNMSSSSITSGQSRVLPFAKAFATSNILPAVEEEAKAEQSTKRRDMYIPPSSTGSYQRFALAQPRRVITPTYPTTNSQQQQQQLPLKRRLPAGRKGTAIGIGTLMSPPCRSTPKIGLGVTMHPANTMVKLQPRRTVAEPVSSPLTNETEDDTACSIRQILSSPVLSPTTSDSNDSNDSNDSSSSTHEPISPPPDMQRSITNDTCISLVPIGDPTLQNPPESASRRPDITADNNAHMSILARWKSEDSILASQTTAPASSVKQLSLRPKLVTCLLCFEQVFVGEKTPPACPSCNTILAPQ